MSNTLSNRVKSSDGSKLKYSSNFSIDPLLKQNDMFFIYAKAETKQNNEVNR